RRDAADFLIVASNARRSQRGHTHDLDERNARQLVKGSYTMIHAHDARGQSLAVGHDAHPIATDDKLTAILWSEHVLSVRHIQRAVAIGHQGQAIRSLDLVG